MTTSYMLSHPDHKSFLVVILQDDDEVVSIIQEFIEFCLTSGWSVDPQLL
jgi:hypothetical protein